MTTLIERLLNQYVDGKRRARWLQDFEAVTRGSKSSSADGRPEMQPDLHFRPPAPKEVVYRSDWAWFVESKIVDGAKSVGLYCAKGVQRFSSGAYAARMPTATMVAYVRDGQQPYKALDPKLTDRTDRFATTSHRPGRTADVSTSRHLRRRLPQPCVDIELTHLWLQVTDTDKPLAVL